MRRDVTGGNICESEVRLIFYVICFEAFNLKDKKIKSNQGQTFSQKNICNFFIKNLNTFRLLLSQLSSALGNSLSGSSFCQRGKADFTLQPPNSAEMPKDSSFPHIAHSSRIFFWRKEEEGKDPLSRLSGVESHHHTTYVKRREGRREKDLKKSGGKKDGNGFRFF